MISENNLGAAELERNGADEVDVEEGIGGAFGDGLEISIGEGIKEALRNLCLAVYREYLFADDCGGGMREHRHDYRREMAIQRREGTSGVDVRTVFSLLCFALSVQSAEEGGVRERRS